MLAFKKMEMCIIQMANPENVGITFHCCCYYSVLRGLLNVVVLYPSQVAPIVRCRCE
jgi:hypothetical protein